MNVYISLLRGINVSGQNKIKMADLRAMYEALGFSNVETYIQSGNVVFTSKKQNRALIKKAIEEKINEVFGFDVKIMLLVPEELSWAIKNHPFVSEGAEKLKKIFVVFLENAPSTESRSELLNHVKDWPEEIKVDRNMVFLHAVNGYGRIKLNNNFVERKLGMVATTRNWKTVNVLFGMTKELT